MLKDKIENKNNKVSNGYISVTNLTDEQLSIISSNGTFKNEVNVLLSNPNALLFLKIILNQQ